MGGEVLKKKIILALSILLLILACIYAPFWLFSAIAIPVMLFSDLCYFLLPVVALCMAGFSISAFFTNNYTRFNNVIGILTLILIVTLMNLFIEAVRLSVVAILFMIPILFAYWIFKKKDVRYYLLIFPALILVIMLILNIAYKNII